MVSVSRKWFLAGVVAVGIVAPATGPLWADAPQPLAVSSGTFALPDAVLRDLGEAVDGGRREVFLAVLRGAAAARPEAAPALAAAGCLLAPWMGELVAGTVLRAVPRPDEAAPVVLAAALVALEGRRTAAVGRAVRRVAPGADSAMLEGVEAVFAEALAAGTPAGFAAAQAYDLPAPLWDVLARGRAANARSEAWLRLWQALPPAAPPVAAGPERGGPERVGKDWLDGDGGEGPAVERQDPILESRFRVPSGS